MLEPDIQNRLQLESIMSDIWVTDKSKKPLLPLPSEVTPHDVRRKVKNLFLECFLGSHFNHSPTLTYQESVYPGFNFREI